ncbi:protein maelstrom 2 [Nilaparvata lugens]|uniref:protein maelstrom 2 n=1 Tax=Nilaparvata lugens TaxID=108931 RepID=UPI000B984AA9|nr:protein maelstrom 2 [Nilaparvata lugens]
MNRRKKPIVNAFSCFMRDFQSEQRAAGRNYTLEQCSKLCDQLWKALPETEKAYYQSRANAEKNRLKAEKYNSLGEPLERVLQRQLGEDLKIREMNGEIEYAVHGMEDPEILLTKVFHLIHINYFCKDDRGQFYPAEMAMAEFTIRDGLIRVVHSLINSGKLPVGYFATAREHCADTHRTPLDLKHNNKPLESQNPTDFLKSIMKILQPENGTSMGEMPPLYTMPDEVNVLLNESCVLNALDIFCLSQNLSENTFKVYSLPKLFYELRNKAQKDTCPSVSTALSILETDTYKYTNGIACDFHEEEDVAQYCSKSIVQRWVYTICDHICKDFKVAITPGFHVPKQADLDGASRNRRKHVEEKPKASAPLKENRNTNYIPRKEEPLREPHYSRSGSYWDSDASSVHSSVVTTADDGNMYGGAGAAAAAVEEPPRRTWSNMATASSASGSTASGWAKVASADAVVPKFDNLDDFPSIGGSRSNNNQNRRGRGRGQTNLIGDFRSLRMD